MERTRLAALRLTLAGIAVVAIVAMHGSAADAHVCRTPAAKALAASAEHGPNPGHGSGTDHRPRSEGGSSGAHCTTMACSTSMPVAEAPTTRALRWNGVLRPAPGLPLASATSGPEPPVPRALLHR